jgi:cytoskeletal protein CcmA (bactofilin family)
MSLKTHPFNLGLPESSRIEEASINIISEGTHLEGKIEFDSVSRVHGSLTGEIKAKEKSILILCETSLVEGNIQADTLMIDGYVRGDVTAKTRVVISQTGRVIGNIKTPSLIVKFGGYFEGRCAMDSPTEQHGFSGLPVSSPA